MGVFICEKCGKLDNTACNNNYWHAFMNKGKQSDREGLDKVFTDKYAYFEDHVCCSDCCEGVRYADGSRVYKKDGFDIQNKQHWTEIGKETLLEWEARHDGSMENATEFFSSLEEV